MIRIKPIIEHSATCPACGVQLKSERVIWQGIHICSASVCSGCGSEIASDLPVGQAIFCSCQVDMTKGLLHIIDDGSRSWFGEPLLRSLRQPSDDQSISLKVERFQECSRVVILNCIDFLYGHGLLKLLNAERHLEHPEIGLVVIVPEYLRWLVPDGIAEIWTVNIPLSKAWNYYRKFDELVGQECSRFTDIWLSRAHSHPQVTDISRYTRTPRHDFQANDFRITFIWREDRLWLQSRMAVRIARRIGMMPLLLLWQHIKVSRLFAMLRPIFPAARFTIAGMGKTTSFADWIEDRRVVRFDDDVERRLAVLYGESRLVIGTHGSNLLLPSGMAGMTVNLMPDYKWSNFAQDIVYQETDSRLAAYRYRYLPLSIGVKTLFNICVWMINTREWYYKAMAGHNVEKNR